MNYKKAYKVLFNAITDALRELQNSHTFSQPIENGIAILEKAQQTTENIYLEDEC